jgi:hypothetical protein
LKGSPKTLCLDRKQEDGGLAGRQGREQPSPDRESFDSSGSREQL